MEVIVIANPVAGKGKTAEKVNRLRSLVKKKELSFKILETDGRGSGEKLARQVAAEGAGVVVAMGGDGTVREVMNGLRGSEVPLGIIPTGTGNDIARSLGLPSRLEKAIELLRDPSVYRVDMGEEGGKLFGALNVGFPVQVMEKVNSARNGLFKGSSAFLVGILRALARLESFEMEIVLDGKKFQTWASMAFVMNTEFTGGGLLPAPAASPLDGRLDLMVAGPVGRWELLKILPRAYQGRHVEHPRVSVFQGSSIEIRTDRPLSKVVDGELEGRTPIRAEAMAKEIPVVVPPSFR